MPRMVEVFHCKRYRNMTDGGDGEQVTVRKYTNEEQALKYINKQPGVMGRKPPSGGWDKYDEWRVVKKRITAEDFYRKYVVDKGRIYPRNPLNKQPAGNRADAANEENARRAKNRKECLSILRYIPKHGIDSDTIVERIEDMLKAYVEDLKYDVA